MIHLTYPSKEATLSPVRSRVLYYIGGWLMSKVWQYQFRNGIPQGEWMWFVMRNHSKSAAAAVELDPALKGMTDLVEARNDPVNGAGLLFVSLRFYDFLLTVESAYAHVFEHPVFLAAHLGNLSDRLLTLVTESTVVKKAWTACCDFAAGNAGFAPNIKVLEVVRLFVLGKFHNLRMYEYTVRVSDVSSTLGKGKATQMALRTGLKAGSKKAGSGTGGGAGSGTEGGAADAGGQSRSGRGSGKGAKKKAQKPETLEEVKGMGEVELKLLKKTWLAELCVKAGAVANQWELKQHLVDKLMDKMAAVYAGGGVDQDSTGAGGVAEVAEEGGGSTNIPTPADDFVIDHEREALGREGADWLRAVECLAIESASEKEIEVEGVQAHSQFDDAFLNQDVPDALWHEGSDSDDEFERFALFLPDALDLESDGGVEESKG